MQKKRMNQRAEFECINVFQSKGKFCPHYSSFGKTLKREASRGAGASHAFDRRQAHAIKDGRIESLKKPSVASRHTASRRCCEACAGGHSRSLHAAASAMHAGRVHRQAKDVRPLFPRLKPKACGNSSVNIETEQRY
jgi:hypothetical protein